jgi:flavin reductase (DIM6/NTAB) family NADH-FMN oxidoreductase RutF
MASPERYAVHLDSSDFAAMERRDRAALVNCLSGFKAANLVGTADLEGHSNLAIMSSAVHLGSNPPLLALVLRPDAVERHTLDNIRATGCYSLNHVHDGIIEAAHQTAARYPRHISEFSATGLSERWIEGFPAPLVAEARVRLGLRLREEQVLAINGTHLLIGEVVLAELPEEAITGDGALDPALAGTVALAGLDSYYRAQHLKRMAYAKPELSPRERD